jgi:hypothetical protein
MCRKRSGKHVFNGARCEEKREHAWIRCPKQKRHLLSRWNVYRYPSYLRGWNGSGKFYVAGHIRFCGVGRYVASGIRFWLGMYANGPRRHIIPIKGFAGTASVRRRPSSVLGCGDTSFELCFRRPQSAIEQPQVRCNRLLSIGWNSRVVHLILEDGNLLLD